MITVQTYALAVVPVIVVATCLAAVLWSRRAARRYDALARKASR